MWHYLMKRNFLEFRSIFYFSNLHNPVYNIISINEILSSYLMTFIHITRVIQDVSALFLQEAVAFEWIMNLKENYTTGIFFSKSIFSSSEGRQCHVVVKLKITGLETNKIVRSPAVLSTSAWPWTSYFTTLILSFVICKIEIIIELLL